MKLFKERLIETGIHALFWIIGAGISIASFIGFSSLSENTINVIGAIVMCIMLLTIVIFVIYKIVIFLKWLFVEPFRKGREKG
ncbi:hypothetical protein M1D49_07980 [Bacillus sp. PK3-056]|uniref:hypothetical protein n=1 Tax=Niallia circulans TaxID=1397 RepID=UPI000F45DBDA|nr:hypothetical protein [Niallia circulans]AYV74297.1 hypothetical protein C2H98_23560 [Niallia circulans]